MNTSDFFKSVFENAEHNSILIMDTDGVILETNNAFRSNFGYRHLEGQRFDILFTENDRKAGKPARELQEVKLKGCSGDDNYLVNREGMLVWVSGESILVKHTDGADYIVKIVQDIHAQKQLERFLVESNEFLESIFNAVKDRGLLILDNLMRILKVNETFIRMFELEQPVTEGSRLTDIDHLFWNGDEVRRAIRSTIVTNRSLGEKTFPFVTRHGEKKEVSLFAKPIHLEPTLERKIFVMIREI